MRADLHREMRDQQPPDMDETREAENNAGNPQTSSLCVHVPHFLTSIFALSAKIGCRASVSDAGFQSGVSQKRPCNLLGHRSSAKRRRLHDDSDRSQADK